MRPLPANVLLCRGVELLPWPRTTLRHGLQVLAQHLDVVGALLLDRTDQRARDLLGADLSSPEALREDPAVEQDRDRLGRRQHRARRADLGLAVLGHTRAHLLEQR